VGIFDGYVPTQPTTRHLAVFDGKTLALAWKSAPVERAQHVFAADLPFAIVGTRIALATQLRTMRVFDGATGAELSRVDVAAPVALLCRVRSSNREVWLEMVNEQSAILDVVSGALTSTTTAPPGCASGRRKASRNDSASCGRNGLCWDLDDPRDPKKRGELDVVADGDLGVAKARLPSGEIALSGVDVKAKKVLWTSPPFTPGVESEPLLDVVGGRFFKVSRQPKKLRVECLEVATGRLSWAYEPAPSARAFVDFASPRSVNVGASRVYLNRGYTLDVLDKATGKLLGVIGQEQ
jgi:hypothetical protein